MKELCIIDSHGLFRDRGGRVMFLFRKRVINRGDIRVQFDKRLIFGADVLWVALTRRDVIGNIIGKLCLLVIIL